MSKIPATNRMISTVILNPQNGAGIQVNTAFKVQVQTKDLAAGSVTDATSAYYSAPQDLNGAEQIIGHIHVVIQNTGRTLNPTTPLDPTQFVFFGEIKDAGNGPGLLTAQVAKGLQNQV
jgi:transcription initiation factor TFIID subunit 15